MSSTTVESLLSESDLIVKEKEKTNKLETIPTIPTVPEIPTVLDSVLKKFKKKAGKKYNNNHHPKRSNPQKPPAKKNNEPKARRPYTRLNDNRNMTNSLNQKVDYSSSFTGLDPDLLLDGSEPVDFVVTYCLGTYVKEPNTKFNIRNLTEVNEVKTIAGSLEQVIGQFSKIVNDHSTQTKDLSYKVSYCEFRFSSNFAYKANFHIVSNPAQLNINQIMNAGFDRFGKFLYSKPFPYYASVLTKNGETQFKLYGAHNSHYGVVCFTNADNRMITGLSDYFKCTAPKWCGSNHQVDLKLGNRISPNTPKMTCNMFKSMILFINPLYFCEGVAIDRLTIASDDPFKKGKKHFVSNNKNLVRQKTFDDEIVTILVDKCNKKSIRDIAIATLNMVVQETLKNCGVDFILVCDRILQDPKVTEEEKSKVKQTMEAVADIAKSEAFAIAADQLYNSYLEEARKSRCTVYSVMANKRQKITITAAPTPALPSS